MSFPLIPLYGFLSGLKEINVEISAVFAVFIATVAFACLFTNGVLNDRGYDEGVAKVGVGALVLAVFISIVGVVYPMTFVAVGLVLYILVYWVIWRMIIKNVIVALQLDVPKQPRQPKSKKK